MPVMTMFVRLLLKAILAAAIWAVLAWPATARAVDTPRQTAVPAVVQDGAVLRDVAQNKRRPKDHDRARDAVRQGEALPLAQIIRSLQATCPGTFLNAQLERRGNALAYRVRLLRPSGRRVTVIVDARSGRMIGGSCR